MRNNQQQQQEDLPSFEGTSENLLRSGRLHSLYYSDKWEFGRWRSDKGKGHDPKYKNKR